MKTIDNISTDFKVNLILYKVYKREYLSGWINMALVSIMLIPFSIFLSFIPDMFYTFFPDAINEYLPKEQLLLSFFSITILSYLLLLISVLLLGLSVFVIDKRRRQLQVAFQLDNNAQFDDIFDISNDDIKNVKRIWRLK